MTCELGLLRARHCDADGYRFLMVKLSMKILGSLTTLTRTEFVKSLYKLPDVPTDLYKTLWVRIQEQNEATADLAKRIFAWVTYSRRKLSLLELRHLRSPSSFRNVRIISV